LPDPKLLPIHKRFPGQHVIRSSIWLPDEKEPLKYSHRISFEGDLHPTLADAFLALQIHQHKVTPAMVKQLKAMTQKLTGKKK
jgi:hypothetical protein